MKTEYISSSNTGFVATTNHRYILDTTETLSNSGGTALAAMDLPEDGATFSVNGKIEGTTTGVSLETDAARNGRVEIGETGSVSAQNYGVYVAGTHNVVVNHGFVEGTGGSGRAINMIGEHNKVVNHGELSGYIGIYFHNGNVSVVNSGTISTKDDAIYSGAEPGETMRVVNTGTLSTEQGLAFSGYTGDETFINRGDVAGDILLGAGKNVFVNRGGSVSGTITSGTGNDRFLIDRADLQILDTEAADHDVVKTSVSWTLGENFEEGRLVGKAKLSLTGSDGDNMLRGNVSANKLSGMDGIDSLDGGRGNDRLTGGDAADTFIFRTHTGRDVVADFENGSDLVDLHAYKGIDNFADLKGHISQSGDDVVISLLNGDQITLHDTQKSEIGHGDFVF